MTDDANDPIPAINYLLALESLKRGRAEIDQHIRELIRRARTQGITWRELGEVLGTSGQAAWERYRPDSMP